VADEQLVKITFEENLHELCRGGTESLWAGLIRTPAGFTYELLNSPFYVRGISYLDRVYASPSEWGLKYRKIAERGGHSTYWLLVPASSTRFEEFWKPLQVLGCTYESGNQNLQSGPATHYSVDVPPNTNIHEVYNLLAKGQAAKVWGFAEGHCGRPIDRS